MIALDTAAIRATHMAACDAQIAIYLADEAAIRQFYEHDQAAFETWLHVTLGATHSELRAAVEAAHAARVRYEQARAASNLPRTLEDTFEDIVQHAIRAGGPHKACATAEADDATPDDADDGMTERECTAEGRAREFALQAQVFGVKPAAVEQRVKGIYRQLCRALHPDVGGALTPELAWLWRDVHAAYADGDFAALFALETRFLIHTRWHATTDSVSDLLCFLSRVHTAHAMVQQQVTALTYEPGWQFNQWTAQQRQRVQRRMRRELENDIADAYDDARYYDEERAALLRRQRQQQRRQQQPPAPPRPQVKRARPPVQSPVQKVADAAVQDEFTLE